MFNRITGVLLLSALTACSAGFHPAEPPLPLRQAQQIGDSHWQVYGITGVYPTHGGAVNTVSSHWFTGRQALVKMSADGSTYTIFPLGSFDPTSLAAGRDGRIYTTACCSYSGQDAVVATDSKGKWTPYVPPSGDGLNDGVTLGPDRNIWFTEFTHVAKITPAGVITEYKLHLPDGLLANTVAGVAAGPDGRIWFPINNNNQAPYNGYLAALDPSTGKVQLYATPCFDPQPVVTGLDGYLYAACRYVNSTQVNILRMSRFGTTKVFSDPFGIVFYGANTMIPIANGIYFITFTGARNPNALGLFGTLSHDVSEIAPPPRSNGLSAIALGPDWNLWGLGASEEAAMLVSY